MLSISHVSVGLAEAFEPDTQTSELTKAVQKLPAQLQGSEFCTTETQTTVEYDVIQCLFDQKMNSVLDAPEAITEGLASPTVDEQIRLS